MKLCYKSGKSESLGNPNSCEVGQGAILMYSAFL